MEGLDPLPRSRSSRTSVRRRRAVLISVLPVVLLGASYFLVIEFTFRSSAAFPAVPAALRIGGVALVVLFLFVSLGAGLYLADQLRRPLRILLRRVESAIEPVPETDLYISEDPEVRKLVTRVAGLVQRSRAGEQALRDLEALRGETEEIAAALRRGEESRRLPDGVNGRGGALGSEVGRFIAGLRKQMREIDGNLERVAEILSRNEIVETAVATEADRSLQDLERLATVWSLQVERTRRELPDMPGELGSCFREFRSAMERLREAMRAQERDDPVLVRDARSEIEKLHKVITDWLRDQKGTTQ